MAAEVDCFDEDLLFKEFEVEKVKTTVIGEFKGYNEKRSSKSLKEENIRLKKALKTLISILKVAHAPIAGSESLSPEVCLPLFQAVFFDNRTSIRNREKVEEFVQSLQQRNSENGDERELFGSENFPPSIFELNYELEKLISQGDGCNKSMAVISSLQYYDQYCIDCCGLPLIDYNPNISGGWNIPKYEQVYFRVLPHDEETPRVKIKQSRACFNCGNFGHNVQDCLEPRDAARISANRRDFVNKFASPITGTLKSTKCRYHGDELVEKRFEGFKPGAISANLKEALGLGREDLPLYIYRMRYHGYPPGYLPKAARPSLLLYDGDGNVDDYLVEDDNVHISLIEYPGFNVPLPEGVKDNSAMMGMPPMQIHQQNENLAALFRRSRGSANSGSVDQNKKRKRPALDREEEDMEVEEEAGKNTSVELGSVGVKRTKYDLEDSHQEGNTGYSPSHPGVQCGSEEQELLKRYRRQSASSATPHHPTGGGLTSQSKKKRKNSLEEGEVISDYEGVEDDEEEEDDFPQTTLNWWLKEPLEAVSNTQPKVSPPPKPSVQLPLEALSRFYTNSTVLQKMSFEDRVMWLDPLYGNIQPVSGRYDKLRQLLGKKSAGK